GGSAGAHGRREGPGVNPGGGQGVRGLDRARGQAQPQHAQGGDRALPRGGWQARNRHQHPDRSLRAERALRGQRAVSSRLRARRGGPAAGPAPRPGLRRRGARGESAHRGQPGRGPQPGSPMTDTTDVVVVGGGGNGASIADALAARGVRVVLVDKGALAGGASGRSSALVRMHYTTEWDARLAWASFPVFRNWAELMGGPPVFTRAGF